MKIKYLFPAALITVLMSCSTAYKTGQTPDDVYFSPAPETSQEYVLLDEDADEEREIRSQMRSLRYRNQLSLGLAYGNQFGSYYSPFYGMNYPGYSYFSFYYNNPWISYSPFYYSYSPFYNPYAYMGYYRFDPYYNYYPWRKGDPIYNKSAPRTTNLGGYTNAPRVPVPQTVRGNDGKSYTPNRVPVRQFPTTQPNSEPKSTGVGGFLRKIFSPSGTDGSKTTTTTRPNRTFEDRTTTPRTFENNRRDNTPPPTRTFTPNPTPPPSNGGSAPVRTFRKN